MIDVRMLVPGDEALLLAAAPGLFDRPVDPSLAGAFLGDPRHHIAAAVDAGTVVGFASALDYLNPDKPRELWINEVAVAPSHRGRGLGKAIVAAMLAHGHALGCATVWVLTDRENTPANRLYASLGGRSTADLAHRKQPVMYEFEGALPREPATGAS